MLSASAQELFAPPPPVDGQGIPRVEAPPAEPLPFVPPPEAFPHRPVPPGFLPPEPVFPADSFLGFERPLPLRDYGWVYVDAPQPREIAVNDIITIIVKEQARTSVDSRYNRNRIGTLKAELKEFLRLSEDGNLTNAAADNQPTIDGNLTSRLQSTGQAAEREEIIYRIAATVMDVKPNGTLELSARKTINANGDLLEYELSGTLRAQDVNRDNTALSENIANLQILKKQRGKVFDATKRTWGVKLYDLIFPF
jgi:flagellar L-ring protein precursor FlgH